MKVRTLIGSFVAAGVVLAGVTAASAGEIGFGEPSLIVSPEQGEPEFEFTMRIEPCPPMYTIEFVVPGDSDSMPCPLNGLDPFITSKTFTAPATPGTYPVYAVVSYQNMPVSFVAQEGPGEPPVDCLEVDFDADVCALFGEITVLAPEATTTTTVVDETTTTVVDETTTTLDDSGVPVPTTAPTGTLPATGGSSTRVPVSSALVVLLAGLALLAVTRAARRTT